MRQTTPKCALVTGASLGLGRALAAECASRGMDLILVSLPGDGLVEAAGAIEREHGVRVERLEIDLTEQDAPSRVLAAIHRLKLPVDALVNNAGIGKLGFFSDIGIRLHEAAIGVNVSALVRLTHALLPELARREGAWILNVASLSAFFPMPYLPTYSATKSFVVTFGLALREELSGAVSVSTLCPNTIRTNKETEEFIDKLSFPCRKACLYPHEVARAGIEGMLRGKAIIVPGAVNKLLRAVGPLVPASFAARVIRRYWGSYETEEKALAAGSA
jgi:uncharacterized protein